ncbi:MAG: PD40 domain-containing protein [Armatimonadetes bacterium]|nr:PD40 domain-containing protein [Armatimonadota bacterium]
MSATRIRQRWPLVRLAGLLASGLLCLGASADPLADAYPAAPANALLRKLEGGLGGEEPGGGLRLRRQARWAPGLRAVLVDTVLSNPSSRPLSPGALTLLDLRFRLSEGGDEAGYTRLEYRNDQWYGSTYFTGGPDWCRVGKDWHHPGDTTPSIRCFRFPRAGRVTVTGRVKKLHLDGDGIRAAIRFRGEELWQAEIDGKDDQGAAHELKLDVKQGEAIRFVVHKRGQIFCDTTGWDPVVTYEDGTRFQASAAFGTEQGAGGWFYQMEAGGAPAPVGWCLGSELLPRRTLLPLGRTASWAAGGELPFIVLADGATESGLAVAADAAQGWSAQCGYGTDGLLRLALTCAPGTLEPGERRLPTVALAGLEGDWTAAVPLLGRLLHTPTMPALAAAVSAAARDVTTGLKHAPEPDLLAMVAEDWLRQDGWPETTEAFARAARAAVGAGLAPPGSAGEALTAARRRYVAFHLARRDALLSNPLLDFRELLFCKRVPPTWNHEVAQYFGWRQRSGGGLFVLEHPGTSLSARDVLGEQLPPGNLLEPHLSYDGRRVVFSFVACPANGYEPQIFPVNEAGGDEGYFHVYTANVDGTGLRQLTSGPYDDLFPTWLPDGGIAFCSTRRRGYSRCFGPEYSQRWHSYTVHRMDADGGGLRALSVNDVSEWFPEVSNTGELLFARWDYIDRDAVTHQNLWSMRPDGTAQAAVWGNATPSPHCVFQARAVPRSRKIAFIASAHHAVTGGPLCLLDPAVDSNAAAALTRLTPGPFPEAEGSPQEFYESPQPLSEHLFLIAYSPHPLVFQGQPNPRNRLGIYLLTDTGERELLYRNPDIGCTSPVPLRARPAPPVLGSPLPPAGNRGEILISDVYQGLGGVPRGSLRELRVVQILPKTTYVGNSPMIGFAGEENTRAILGSTPILPDGSAHVAVPAGKPLLFQVLDADGLAWQTMRATMSVMPGERRACIGCHESRRSAPSNQPSQAQLRPAVELVPGPLGGAPFSFVRFVQPVLDRRCATCHSGAEPAGKMDLTGTPDRGFTRSYWSLCGGPGLFDGGATNPQTAAAALVPRFGMRNQVQVTPPGGEYGARGSRLLKLLRAGHHGVALEPDELRALAAWIDLNAVFYGSYDAEDQARELRGEPVGMPEIQ